MVVLGHMNAVQRAHFTFTAGHERYIYSGICNDEASFSSICMQVCSKTVDGNDRAVSCVRCKQLIPILRTEGVVSSC